MDDVYRVREGIRYRRQYRQAIAHCQYMIPRNGAEGYGARFSGNECAYLAGRGALNKCGRELNSRRHDAIKKKEAQREESTGYSIIMF